MVLGHMCTVGKAKDEAGLEGGPSVMPECQVEPTVSPVEAPGLWQSKMCLKENNGSKR